MIRILSLIAALICAAPAIAQSLPANLDKANAIVIDTTKGRIVVKLRPDLAPKHAERIKLLAREAHVGDAHSRQSRLVIPRRNGSPSFQRSGKFFKTGFADRCQQLCLIRKMPVGCHARNAHARAHFSQC